MWDPSPLVLHNSHGTGWWWHPAPCSTPQRRGQWGPRRRHQHAWAHPRLGPAWRAARDSVLENGALLQQQQTHHALTAALRLQTQPQGSPCPSCLRRAAPGPGTGKRGPAPGWGLGIGCRASPAQQCSSNSRARAAGPKHRLGGSWGGPGAPLLGVSVLFPLPRWVWPAWVWPAWPLPKAAAAARVTAGSLPCWESSGLGPGTHAAAPKTLQQDVATAQRLSEGLEHGPGSRSCSQSPPETPLEHAERFQENALCAGISDDHPLGWVIGGTREATCTSSQLPAGVPIHHQWVPSSRGAPCRDVGCPGFAAAVGQRGEVATGQGDGECYTTTTPSMLRPAAALQECRGWMAFWKR